MDLDIHDVIIRPRSTTKTQRLQRDGKQLILQVHMEATKPMVERALKSLFNIDVRSVRMMVRKGKQRYSGRRRELTQGVSRKYAIIGLKAGALHDEASALSTVPYTPAPVPADSNT